MRKIDSYLAFHFSKFRMAPLPLFVLFFLSHLLLLSSAEEKKHRPGPCPSFPCGKLGYFSPPLRNNTTSDCGLYTLNCSEPVPKIQLQKGGYWYEIEHISPYGDSISIKSEAPLTPFDPCKANESYALPSPSMISNLSTSNSLSIFNCSHNLGIRPTLSGFKRSTCGEDDIYYTLSNISISPFPEDDIYYTLSNISTSPLPPQCSMFQLPGYNLTTDNKISSLPVFTLDVRVSPDCYHCYHKEGLCRFSAIDHKFSCFETEENGMHNWKTGNKKLALQLGLGIGLPVFIICSSVTLFLIWLYKQRRSASKFVKRSVSDPYLNDPEGGSVYYGVHVFSYKDLEEATNNFDTEKELGDGGFGTVYLGRLKDGREVAVKRLYEHNYKRFEQFKNEIEILARLRHQNLVTLYGCTSRRCRELLLVYEYIPNGTVADHLHGDRVQTSPLTWPVRMSIAIETATALAYLHASDIVHRDVKTNNILLDNNFCVKVADFGLSRLFPIDVTHVSTAPQGTPGYVDPEYHQCYQLTSKSDVYSFGVVLVELISSLPAVDITRHRHEINLSNLAISKIKKRAYNELVDSRLGFDSDSEAKRMTIAVAELAFQCLQQDKEMRPSMDDVLEELKRIESGKSEPENQVKGFDGVTASTQPPPSPEHCDEVGLLKSIKEQPPSPNTVTENWSSSLSSTSNVSG